MRPWVGAEGLVWAGGTPAHGRRAGADGPPSRAARVRRGTSGRFVLATGAVHPVQIDGAHVIARAPWGSMVETFGGLPVVPRFGARSYDWLAGGRVAQTVAKAATLGVSYVQRREDGEISERRDRRRLRSGSRLAGSTSPRSAPTTSRAPARRRLARRPLCAGATGASSCSDRSCRPAGFCRRRRCSPCSATCPSQTVGATVRWRAAPRLDLLASGAGQDVAGGLGGNGWVRATLRLDDRGAGSLGLEVRRVDVPGAQWTGRARHRRGASRQRLSLLVRDRDRRARPRRRARRRLAVGTIGAVVAVGETAGRSQVRSKRLPRRSSATRPTRSCASRTRWTADLGRPQALGPGVESR